MSQLNKEEILQKAYDRGWHVNMKSADGNWYVMGHNYYPFIIELWPNTNEFLLRYNIGLFTYQTGKCGSFTNDSHFDRYFREMRYMAARILEAKEDYIELLKKRKGE